MKYEDLVPGMILRKEDDCDIHITSKAMTRLLNVRCNEHGNELASYDQLVEQGWVVDENTPILPPAPLDQTEDDRRFKIGQTLIHEEWRSRECEVIGVSDDEIWVKAGDHRYSEVWEMDTMSKWKVKPIETDRVEIHARDGKVYFTRSMAASNSIATMVLYADGYVELVKRDASE